MGSGKPVKSCLFSIRDLKISFAFCKLSASILIWPLHHKNSEIRKIPLLNISFIFEDFIYLFIFRQRGKEGEREGEKHQCVVDSCVPTGDLAHNPGMHPDWELSRQPFGLQASAQPTEPHQPGPLLNISTQKQELWNQLVRNYCHSTRCTWGGGDRHMVHFFLVAQAKDLAVKTSSSFYLYFTSNLSTNLSSPIFQICYHLYSLRSFPRNKFLLLDCFDTLLHGLPDSTQSPLNTSLTR